MDEHTVEFAIALPPEFNSIDLLDPGVTQSMPPALAQTLIDAHKGVQGARVMMLRSLIAVTEEREPLAAGLSVAIAAPDVPLAAQPLVAEDFEGSEVAAISLPVGQGLRVRDEFPTEVEGLPVIGLRVQYLLHTEHGLLTITFETPQAAETEDWETFFDAMAQTATLIA
ncbi:MAG TPA: hypothetical protein VFN55_16815 [Solirubrobacteraceae bacterium]|nr:hypothetical protein [Solirubrobacteraceae bacterium]